MDTTPRTTSLVGVLGRVLWLFLGPLCLMLALMGIVNTGQGWLTGADIAYFVILGLMLLGRWLEFQGGAPMTASGEPATSTHLVRYLIAAPVVALVVYVIANVIANQ